VLTLLPAEGGGLLQRGRGREVGATGEVEAGPQGLVPGLAEDAPPVVLHAAGRLVEEGVWAVVRHAVGDDEVEVFL